MNTITSTLLINDFLQNWDNENKLEARANAFHLFKFIKSNNDNKIFNPTRYNVTFLNDLCNLKIFTRINVNIIKQRSFDIKINEYTSIYIRENLSELIPDI